MRSPLAALNEPGNDVLRQAMAGGASMSCGEFWARWIAASMIEGKAPPEDAALTLRSRDEEGSAVRFVVRAELRLGRSSRLSDFVVRSFPDTPENRLRTRQFSRVHVVAEASAEGFSLRDGDGVQPSANGSTWNGQPLTASASAPIGSGGTLRLRPDFAIEVLPMCDAQGEPQAMTFSAKERPAARDAVWLFKRISFDCDPLGHLRWAQDGAASVLAEIGFESGSFFSQKQRFGPCARFGWTGSRCVPATAKRWRTEWWSRWTADRGR